MKDRLRRAPNPQVMRVWSLDTLMWARVTCRMRRRVKIVSYRPVREWVKEVVDYESRRGGRESL